MSSLPAATGGGPLAADTPAAGVTALGAALGEAFTVLQLNSRTRASVPVS